MWILRFKPSNGHGATHLSSSISILLQLQDVRAHYSTTSTQKHLISDRHFMVDYLVNSLGFSNDQAFSASTKVSHLKSTKNPDSVLDFFKQCGLDQTQIKNIVLFSPKILTTSVDKVLEPKVRVFQELGLSGSGLAKVVKQSPCFSSNKLGSNVDYLKKLLNNDEKVIKVIYRSWWLLSSNFAQKLSASILVLQKYGLPKDKIENLLLRNPGCLLQSPNWLESTIEKVEPVLGIPRNSPRFADGIELAVSMAKSTLETKFEVFRRFGWSDSEIHTMVRALPFCVRRAEAKIEVTLKFFMNELGYTATYLATHPKLLVYSLVKRVTAWFTAWLYKFSLCSIVALFESNFIRDFIRGFEHCVTRFSPPTVRQNAFLYYNTLTLHFH